MRTKSRRPVVTPDLLCGEITVEGNVYMPRAVWGRSLTIWRKAISNRLLISIKENGVYTKQSQRVHPDSSSLICTVHTLTHHPLALYMTSLHLPTTPDQADGLQQPIVCWKLILPFCHCPPICTHPCTKPLTRSIRKKSVPMTLPSPMCTHLPTKSPSM